MYYMSDADANAIATPFSQLSTFLLVPLSQPYAGPTAVFVDELDACGL
jgi:hypothetical protein